jgi:four helix bundle protein
MGDFKKLDVWRKAHGLALHAHRVATRIRGPQHLSLRSQIIRAAMSIPANIVEGRAQKGERDFGRFLGYALASASELEYHLIVARDIHVVSEEEFQLLTGRLVQVRKMLHGLLNLLPTTTPTKGPR